MLLLSLFILFYFAFQNDVIMERDNIVSVTLQSMDDNSATFNWKKNVNRKIIDEIVSILNKSKRLIGEPKILSYPDYKMTMATKESSEIQILLWINSNSILAEIHNHHYDLPREEIPNFKTIISQFRTISHF